MLDVLNLPDNPRVNQQIFYPTAAATGVGWQSWVKPRGVSFVQFFVLGGGGGGSSGVLGAASTAAGGGGGGSSATCNIIFPAWAIPDVLYMSVGNGGRGGASVVTTAGPGLVGTVGIASYVSIYPTASGAPLANFLLCIANPGGVGAAPTGATAGTGGAGGTASATSAAPLASKGIAAAGATTNVSVVGVAGTAGGTTGIAPNLTIGTGTQRVLGGTGGAGLGAANSLGQAGGSYVVPVSTPVNIYPAHLGGLPGALNTDPGNAGSGGFNALKQMLYFYGGTGGASAGGTTASLGGPGGAGYYGCGGGGGGGALTGSISGAGGKGGDGLIIATAW